MNSNWQTKQLKSLYLLSDFDDLIMQLQSPGLAVAMSVVSSISRGDNLHLEKHTSSNSGFDLVLDFVV